MWFLLTCRSENVPSLSQNLGGQLSRDDALSSHYQRLVVSFISFLIGFFLSLKSLYLIQGCYSCSSKDLSASVQDLPATDQRGHEEKDSRHRW